MGGQSLKSGISFGTAMRSQLVPNFIQKVSVWWWVNNKKGPRRSHPARRTAIRYLLCGLGAGPDAKQSVVGVVIGTALLQEKKASCSNKAKELECPVLKVWEGV